MDEIRPGFLKALDVVVDTTLHHRVDIEGSTAGLVERMVVALF